MHYNQKRLCPFHTGWGISGDRPRQRKIAFITNSCSITALCRYLSVHTLLAPRQWKIFVIVMSKWTVTRLLRIVEAQLRSSCVWVVWLICKQKLRQSSGETSTISQLSLNRGATNVDCNGEMLEIMGWQITMTIPQHFNKNSTFLEVKNEIKWSCEKWSGYKRPCFHSYSIILSLVIMDPVHRVQVPQLLLQVDDQ